MARDAIIAAGVSSLATLVAVGAGYRQFQRAQRRKENERFAGERAEALKELWTLLADLHTGSRLSEIDSDTLTNSAPRVNAFLIQKSPFLETDEQAWAQEFIASLIEINSHLRGKEPNAESIEYVEQDRWATTGRLPRGVGKVSRAYARMMEASDKLQERYVSVVKQI